MDLQQLFGTRAPLLGMVHLPALPGAPANDRTRREIRDRAVADATTLVENGFDGVVVENYGDTPFFPEGVPKHVVADMTAVTGAVRDAVDVPVGVNVLRNDATAALAVAASTGAVFVRVNVHTGVRVTDQGVIEGQAHETLRERDRLEADVAILADIAVKHSAPLADRPLDQQVADAIERGKADGLVVSGSGTGEQPEETELETVVTARNAVDDAVPVFVGSGVTAENVADRLAVADGAIVGTAVKANGETANPVDGTRASEVVARTE